MRIFVDFKNLASLGFKIHKDQRVFSLTNLENVCVLYGHIGSVIVGLGYNYVIPKSSHNAKIIIEY